MHYLLKTAQSAGLACFGKSARTGLLGIFLSLLCTPMLALARDCATTDLNFSQKRLLGPTENLCEQYLGKVVLVVNVASHCGYTAQYEALEQLYRTRQAQGLVVLGFPSADFGGQEFAEDQEIQKFCKANFGVSFPMFTRSAVIGDQANPLFARLALATQKVPAWNFSKYLLGRNGKVIAHFDSKTAPDSAELQAAIRQALAN